MKENILITGGAGYIGSHIVRDLGEGDRYHPIVYDNLSTGRRESILYGEFIRGDVGDYERVRQVIGKYDIKSVVHFAASIVVEESMQNPIKYYRNNTQNSLTLIRACLDGGVKHFVFSSTAAVYGIPGFIPVSEDAPMNPINPYGKSKMSTEHILKDVAAARKDFNYIALRYFNVAGADPKGRIGQNYEKPTHLITLALRTALGIIPRLYIFGTDYDTPDGTAIRDYIHIDDLSRAHVLALQFLKEKNQSRILNCGYGAGFSVLQVVQAIKRMTNKNFKVIRTDRRPGDPPVLIAANDLITQELGWSPACNDLELIITSALNWEKKLFKL